MQLTDSELAIVIEILSSIDAEVYAFGSRARGTARKDSDLDICLKCGNAEIPLTLIADIRERFANSTLAFTVDLVDYRHLTGLFKDAVDREGIRLK